MKIIATSDWHIGNLFHGNDRLPEHQHFLNWLLEQIQAHQPDALLVAGDVFDNSNPSADAQQAYYGFLADATQLCPTMQIVITAGNHDSANRLEAPSALLSRYHIEVRGVVRRQTDYEKLMIPIRGKDGTEVIVLAVPYLRSDIVQNANYSEGVKTFLCQLTDQARELYPDRTIVMMTHMYAKGADIASRDASEKIAIGGLEEVSMENWPNHPDYLTSGHIHKRQHIWNTDWARYTGSILPMSFAEIDYKHGVDLVTIGEDQKIEVEFLQYHPQHPLVILPEGDEELTPKKLKKLIDEKLDEARDMDSPDSEDYVYLMLKVSMDKVSNDELKEIEQHIRTKNAVLCKTQKILPSLNLSTISGNQPISSIDDILNRDPMDTLREAFVVSHKVEMSEHQEQMLREILQD